MHSAGLFSSTHSVVLFSLGLSVVVLSSVAFMTKGEDVGVSFLFSSSTTELQTSCSIKGVVLFFNGIMSGLNLTLSLL